MNCPNCGNATSDSAVFCGNCGAVLAPNVAVDSNPVAPSTMTAEQIEQLAQAIRDVQASQSTQAGQPVRPAQSVQLAKSAQPAEPVQPEKKRGAGLIIGGMIVAVVIVALLWVALSRGGSPSPQISGPGVSAGAAQQVQNKAELVPYFVGAWKLSDISGKNWAPGEGELEDLWNRGFEVFLTLDGDDAARLDVFGTLVQATWEPVNESRVSIKLGEEDLDGVLEDDQIAFKSGGDALVFTRISAESATLEEGINSSEASSIAVDSLFDLANPDTYLTEQPTPGNGEVLYDDGQWKDSEVTITAPSTLPCYVKLKDTSGNDVMAWWVDAGQTATVQVPGITGEIVYATGGTWYGVDDLFGSNTSYSKPDEVFDFYAYTYELTFQKVLNGNLSTEEIGAEEF